MKKIAVALVFFMALVIFTFRLGQNPPGFHIDEAANAEVVLKEGTAVEEGDPLAIGRWNVAVIAG